jgi:hypothetical protein
VCYCVDSDDTAVLAVGLVCVCQNIAADDYFLLEPFVNLDLKIGQFLVWRGIVSFSERVA